MKMFKHFAIAAISILLLTAGFMIGCKKDTTTHTKPVTYCDTAHCGAGTCDSVDKICYCPDGYEGYACATEIRTRMVGTYLSVDPCTPGLSSYNVTVATSAQGGRFITISNLINEGYTVTAKLTNGAPGSGYTSITIDQQTANGTSGPAVIMGSGGFQNGNMTLSYNIDLGGTTGSCSLTGTKQ
ncbi:MAG: hypothetical protein JST83_03240 [Bacteroidetes bacterium]|nr:hypothetical protein [Bacteroidota bacterium]